MLFAMDSLGRLTEILELKFIQRVEPCQIHHYGSELIIGRNRKRCLGLRLS
jgi:hypothetical protein